MVALQLCLIAGEDKCYKRVAFDVFYSFSNLNLGNCTSEKVGSLVMVASLADQYILPGIGITVAAIAIVEVVIALMLRNH